MTLRNSSGAAWAGPLLLFATILALPGLVRSSNLDAPWYLAMPQLWVFPIQTVVVLGAIIWWWRNYTFGPLNGKIIVWSVVAGAVGIGFWLLPSWMYNKGWVPEIEWLGCVSRAGDEKSFDPSVFAESPLRYWGNVGLRVLRAAVVVALAEELFWRGFLWRMCSDRFRDFSVVPFAQKSWLAFAAVMGGFVFQHTKPDYAASVIYCSIISLLYLRTKSVGACVIAHGVSNLLMSIYILRTGQWGLW
jgi:uncharacterized protein